MAESRTTSTVAEVAASNSANARTTATELDALVVTGPANARVTATELDALVVTGPASARVTSTVLEALRTVTSLGGGWVCVP